MHRSTSIFGICFNVFLACCAVETAVAQKPLADGVLKVIPVVINPRDSFTLPMTLPDLDAPSYDPVYLSKKDTLERLGQRNVFFHDVWEYEFSFVGGLRQAVLNVPNLKSNSTTAKNIWYIIYRIRDRGNTITFEQTRQSPKLDYALETQKRDEPIAAEKKFFLPQFFLEGYVIADAKDATYQPVKYHDKIIPMALHQIQRMHDPSLTLLDPIQMSKTKIPLASSDAEGGVWGVAMFEDVDPRIDFVNLKVEGLSNAFRIGPKQGQPNLRKVLQLNFSRPGGIVDEHKDRIDFGIPLVDDPQKQVLIAERYELPGPTLCCYYINPDAADRRVMVAEIDGQINLQDFSSAFTPTLKNKRLPTAMVEALANAGIDVDPEVPLQEIVPGKRWSFLSNQDRYTLVFEPQYWEPESDTRGKYKIRFIKTLDYLWKYR
jgi:hypothetical protein